MTRALLAAVLALAVSPAVAGSVSIAVSDADGRPVRDAVVELAADAPTVLPASRIAAEAVIDQRHETFLPLVSLVRAGGRVVFTNNDTTKHQVYSFSPIRQFEFEVDQGQRSEPVVFDKPGVASIGCNIHDQMITYVYVAASPFAAMTDARGHAAFDDVPNGAYHAKVWHPQLVPGKPAPLLAVTVSAAPTSVEIPVSLLSVSMSGMKHMHMGRY
ncbi:MAG TPA: hypothetical protein VLT91_05770 [Rhizomicrobium sp.]|nr:hypothetical protein [Rhizomicrobium sp.]